MLYFNKYISKLTHFQISITNKEYGSRTIPDGLRKDIIMNKKEILFVDDDNFILNMYEQTFKRAGYLPYIAESAEDALDILQKKYFHVLFLDLKLPGMNGIELCKTIKVDKPFTICYAVSGYASLFELSVCLKAGFVDYFTKPVNVEVLIEAAKIAFEKIDRWLYDRLIIQKIPFEE